MATVSLWESDALSDPVSDAIYFAGVTVGDNGYLGGVPTAVAGAYGEQQAWSITTWDSNVDDGFDSGWVSVSFAINVGQGGSLEVSDSGAVTFATGAPSTISRVTIQAGVAGGSMQMSWRDVTVRFYSGGSLAESVSVGGIVADTMDQSDWAPAEAGATIQTNATSGYDGVYITAQVRMVTAEGIYPTGADLFGQIAIS